MPVQGSAVSGIGVVRNRSRRVLGDYDDHDASADDNHNNYDDDYDYDNHEHDDYDNHEHDYDHNAGTVRHLHVRGRS